MAVVIDTCVLIDAELGRALDLSVLTGGRDEEAYISVITASELLHGVYRARTDGERARRGSFVESILQVIPILSADLRVARAHAQLWAEMAAKGETIAQHDLWIAATAVAYGYRLATTNVRDFARVPGLIVEDVRSPGSAVH